MAVGVAGGGWVPALMTQLSVAFRAQRKGRLLTDAEYLLVQKQRKTHIHCRPKSHTLSGPNMPNNDLEGLQSL